VLVAATLGLVAAGVLSGPTRLDLHVGSAVISVTLAWWLAGSLAGAPPYGDWPALAVGALSIVDIAVAAVLIVHHLPASGS
jgi:hypothetical protein